jgi:alkylation response protein AidB-like acyl-CoA dehydrogenase
LAPQGAGSAPDARLGRAQADARRIADELLIPNAERTDQLDLVPAEHYLALAEAGLMGLSGPVAYGGLAAPLDVARRVFETLAGACGPTFFSWVQHHSPVRLLIDSDNEAQRQAWLRRLCRGEILAGIGFAHLRRPGPPAVAVAPAAGGWRLAGEAPWVTSWGRMGLLVLAAVSARQQIVWLALPVDPSRPPPPGLRPSPPMALPVMRATGTVRVAFDDVWVPNEQVIAVVDLADWQAKDRVVTAQPNPAVFGLADRCLTLLAAEVERSRTRVTATVAAALRAEWESCRSVSYDLADQAQPVMDQVARLVALRAWSLELVQRASSALLIATGGRGMTLDQPAQRLHREAAFYLIQAQTLAGRAASLERLLR